MIGLCYLLPTTFKKLRLDAHQYLVDIVSNPAEDLHSAERRQPFILVIGTSFADFNKVIVYADGVPVCAFESVTKALYGVLSLYYAFNIEYSAAVFSALQFLQIKCLNIKEKARLSVTDLMNSLDQL